MPYILALLGIVALVGLFKKGFASENTYVDYTETKPLPKVDTVYDIINYYSKYYNVPVALIKAIIKAESSWNPLAKNPNDPSYGLMGIMPIVAQDFGIVKDWRNTTDAEVAAIYDINNNIGCGTKLIGKLLKKYPQEIAIMMYNIGETGYNTGRRNTEYVSRVLNYYYDYGQGG